MLVEREGEVGGKVLRGSSNDAKGSKGGNADEGESSEYESESEVEEK